MPEPTRVQTDTERAPPTREWLITNGLGGYASGTVPGELSRRYHGLLISAQPASLGRVLTLVELHATVDPEGAEPRRLGGPRVPGSSPAALLESFELDHGLPVWTWSVDGRRIRRRVVMPYRRNAVSVELALLAGDAVEILLRPLFQPRGHDAPVGRVPEGLEADLVETGLDVHCPGFPTVRIRVPDDVLRTDDPRTFEVRYPVEAARGYPSEGMLWSPGTLASRLEPGRPLTLIASTDRPDEVPSPAHAVVQGAEIERREALVEAAGASGDPLEARLAIAADAFIFEPLSRAHEPGARSVIAGYHWFTDWGRDTMISLEGLTLTTGRAEEAAAILRTFGRHVRDGLIPNLFPEGDTDGLYHTADATLWFFHAVHRYVESTGHDSLLHELIPTLRGIVDHHVRGTRFGIGVDPEDDLLRQGVEDYPLTWMDAKVDGWVVTPRRGKPVEINALWYNALRLMADWLREPDPDAADRIAERAARTRSSFNRRFWYTEGGYLYDVVDGEDGDPDPAFRPNQIFALSLDHPVLARERWASVLERVEERLLTPVGLRSLAPGHPDYAPSYAGDLRARDAAYHQGTVWGWLIGPFIDAWLRVHPDRRADARRYLEGLVRHLDEACVGSMSEVFDAEPPFTPRGCVAQAWTVAEVARCLRRTDGSDR
ncbi:MAG: amylo-alpha-1,6-glucosidase [Gemmatimonadota bacterium]